MFDLDRDIVVVDLETTNVFDSEGQLPRIIEVGAIRFNPRRLLAVDALQAMIYPGDDTVYHPRAMEVNGIDPETLKAYMPWGHYSEVFNQFCEDATLAAWPISYELPVLQMEYARAGKKCPLDRRGIDIATLTVAYMVKTGIKLNISATGREGYSLQNVRHTLGVPQTTTHRALEDARSEMAVLMQAIAGLGIMEKQLQETEVEKFVNERGSEGQIITPSKDIILP